MNRLPALIVLAAAILILAGCSSGPTTAEPSEASGTVPSTTATTDAAAQASTTSSSTSTTDAVQQASTTSSSTSNTSVVDGDLVFLDQFTMDEGWKYGIRVVYTGPAIEESPGACLPTPPPGRSNVSFVVTVMNLVDDRRSPYPPMLFASNLTKDGVIVPDGGLFETTVIGFDSVEVYPNESARLALCGLEASVVAPGLGEIEPGRSVEFQVTVGSVGNVDLEAVELGIRFFGVEGSRLDAFMTTFPDSGRWVVPE